MTAPPGEVSRRVELRAAAAQLLWSAGAPLTAGGFVVSAAREGGAGAWAVALLLILPETAGLSGLGTRSWLATGRSRKRLYVVTTVLSRLILLPAAAVHGGSGGWIVAAAAIALSHAVAAPGYVALLSWLSDVVSGERWGRLFAWRQAAQVVGLLTLPVAAGFAERAVRDGSDPEAAAAFGTALFVVGLSLQAASVLPLLAVRDREYEPDETAPGLGAAFRVAWRRGAFRAWAVHEWAYASAAGLTQAAFFLYATSATQLDLSLGTYYGLLAVMRIVQLAVSPAAAVWADATDDPARARLIAMAVASSGLLFWLAAGPESRWQLAGAYLCWGAFAVANVAGRKLLLVRAGGRDNAAAIGLSRQVAGFLAGASGLLGGLWLDANDGTGSALPFHLLFAVSLVGRFAALVPLAYGGRRNDSAVSVT